MFRRKWQKLRFTLSKHLELIRHALSRKIHCLKFERAPVHRVARWMNKNVVYAANEIARIVFVIVL